MAQNNENITNYTHFIVLPLKIVGCWEWYPKPTNDYQNIINNVYLCMVLFVLTDGPIALMVNLYTEWVDIMGSLNKIADGLPLIVALAIVAYLAFRKSELYELVHYMNNNFKYRSARGLTNMTMEKSYITAKNFGYIYTACTLFSVTMYVTLPVINHFMTKQPLQHWIYMDVSRSPYYELVFLKQCLGQGFLGLAFGQLGVFFASNAILLCGQLDILCCSLRNIRYTVLLQNGVRHAALAADFANIQEDEKNSYSFNEADITDSQYHYNTKINANLLMNKIYFYFEQLVLYQDNTFVDRRTHYDIYNSKHDPVTMEALRECARMCQIIANYKEKFEYIVSPLLTLRVVQVTLYLCTLLYSASLKIDMLTVEYLGAVAFDMFVYCHYGNQIIIQAGRVSTAAYQSAWHTMGVRPRRMLLNILLANKHAVKVRAGGFLPMDLHTFLIIIKTSFSYYTLLANVNEH